MDSLSVTASIITILQLTNKVTEYLNTVKDAPKEREQCAIEALKLLSLPFKLKGRVGEGSFNERWYATVRELGTQNGQFDQCKHALEQLQG